MSFSTPDDISSMPATAEKRLAVYAHTFAFLHGIKQDEVMRIQTEDEKSGPIKELSLVHDLAEEADAMVQDPDRCRAFKEKMRCALTPSKDVGVTELMMRAQNYQAMHEALNTLTKNNKDVESARAFTRVYIMSHNWRTGDNLKQATLALIATARGQVPQALRKFLSLKESDLKVFSVLPKSEVPFLSRPYAGDRHGSDKVNADAVVTGDEARPTGEKRIKQRRCMECNTVHAELTCPTCDKREKDQREKEAAAKKTRDERKKKEQQQRRDEKEKKEKEEREREKKRQEAKKSAQQKPSTKENQPDKPDKPAQKQSRLGDAKVMDKDKLAARKEAKSSFQGPSTATLPPALGYKGSWLKGVKPLGDWENSIQALPQAGVTRKTWQDRINALKTMQAAFKEIGDEWMDAPLDEAMAEAAVYLYLQLTSQFFIISPSQRGRRPRGWRS